MPKVKDIEKKGVSILGMVNTPLCLTATYSRNGTLSFSVGGIDSIVCYSPETMSFRSGKTTVSFEGKSLECTTYSNKTIEVKGKIKSVNFTGVE